MSLSMYLLRHEASSLSSALYAPEKRNISVHVINPQSDDPVGSQQVAFIHVGKEDSLTNRDQLTYAQLLELVLKAEKVVTL